MLLQVTSLITGCIVSPARGMGSPDQQSQGDFHQGIDQLGSGVFHQEIGVIDQQLKACTINENLFTTLGH